MSRAISSASVFYARGMTVARQCAGDMSGQLGLVFNDQDAHDGVCETTGENSRCNVNEDSPHSAQINSSVTIKSFSFSGTRLKERWFI
jgi:hypothetical protein